LRTKKHSESDGRPFMDEEEKMHRVSIGLDLETMQKLKKEAIARNISFSKIIREKLKKAGV
jgi:Ribbon-helix-helix protein, copG family